MNNSFFKLFIFFFFIFLVLFTLWFILASWESYQNLLSFQDSQGLEDLNTNSLDSSIYFDSKSQNSLDLPKKPKAAIIISDSKLDSSQLTSVSKEIEEDIKVKNHTFRDTIKKGFSCCVFFTIGLWVAYYLS